MSTAQLDAQARLSLSRLHLRLALVQERAAQGPPPGTGAAPDWQNHLNSDPVLGALLQTVLAWWAQHPLQDAAAMATLAASALLRPLAQRHPIRLVLGAAAIGGALVLFKPWRWISIPTLAAGLLPQLLAKLITQLHPVSWTEVFSDWLQTGNKPQTTARAKPGTV